jgi:transcription factor SPN1
MSSTKNDLFGDSSSSDGSDGGGDTDDLIAAAKSQPIATKKKKSSGSGNNTSSKNKKRAPDADNDSDDDSDSDDDEDFASPEKESGGGGGGGLFDSSSEEEDDEDDEKPTKKKRKTTANNSTTAKKLSSKKNKGKKSSPTKKLKKDGRTMKEKMEELAKKKRQAAGGDAEKDDDNGPRRKRSKPSSKGGEDGSNDDKKKEGYESGDSYDSKTFARTKEDDDFIDADDEDPEALKELYAEQHFDDERPDGSDSEDEKKKKKVAATKKKSSSSGGGVDKISLSDDEGEGPSASSALKDAVRRMQKKKKEVKKLPQLEQEASTFLQRMDVAADMDEESISAKKPALKKLGMLSEVMEMLAQKDMQRVLLDLDLLMVCKRWIQPLPPDGKTLGNVTVRRRIIESLSNMTGESGINSTDLKRSGFGKVVMALYKHKSETPELKKMLKTMIEQWSRPIFQKSGNMRDLERAQMVRGMNEMGSLVGIARQQQQQLLSSGQKSGGGAKGGSGSGGGRGGRATDEDDLAQIINHGSKNTNDIGNNRVRVPFSKGFQFSVRPADRTGDVSDKRNLVSAKAARGSMGRGEEDKKDSLQKRMASKARPTNKQSQRSANISIEGRVVK